MHARSGGQLEVMGILQGKLEENTFVVLDAFALPVEGTETRKFSGSRVRLCSLCLLACFLSRSRTFPCDLVLSVSVSRAHSRARSLA